jgi:hypothetical protein
LLVAGVLLGVAMPGPADALCCLCRNCVAASFCADGVGNSVVCATLCLTSGCSSDVFDSTDTCAGGCDGAPAAPTITPSSTKSQTPTATASTTPTATASATRTATSTTSATPSATPTATVTDTPGPSRTPTTTPTVTPTPTPSTTPALGGHVRYYRGDRPVPGVSVDLIGGSPATAMSDATGAFGFASVAPGMQTLQPTKQDDIDTAVTALDASYVLEYVAGMRDFDDDQRLAADVTGNGTVSPLDATRILQFQSGLLTRFAVANDCGSDWVFRPQALMVPDQTQVQPRISSGACLKGAIAYGEMFSPPAAGQDFVAILFGDTTGNWPLPTSTP